MLSRITIEVDFENGNMPVIQVMHQHSDDVRDALLASFLQSLGHTGRWATLEYQNLIDDKNGLRHRWLIRPIKVDQLQNESKLMAALAKTTNENDPENTIYNIKDLQP